MCNKEVLKDNPPENKFLSFIRNYGFSTLMGVAVVIMFVSPDAKSFVLRQLMHTGLFNASIDKVDSDPSSLPVVDFAFEDGSGDVSNTSSLRGKVVFINFWATWCPPCIAEMPSINKLYDVYRDNENVVFIMADVDNKYEQSVKFMEDKDLTLPVHVPAGEIPGDWLGGAIPTTVILDKTGAIAARHEGMADYSRKEVIDFIQNLIDE